MYVFWDTILQPLLALYQPRRMVEVGSDHGDNTEKLLEFARDNDALVHVVDPLPKYDADEWCARWGDTLIYHKALSLNVLHTIDEMDLVLIDGDHNWYTVRNELELIFKNTVKRGKKLPLILLHDVAWPYGRRDLYYDPETIPPAYRQAYRKQGMAPGHAELLPEGGLNPHLDNAIYENNLKNGVRTAVEDFVAESGEDMRFLVVPALNGLGIVFRPADLADKPDVLAFFDSLPTEGLSYSFVERLEQTRLQGDLDRAALKRRLATNKETLAGVREKLQSTRAKVDEVRAVVTELQGQVKTRDKALAGKDRTIAAAEKTLASRKASFDAAMANARAELKARSFELANTRSELERQKKALAEFEATRVGRAARWLKTYSAAHPRQSALFVKAARLSWWTVTLRLPQKLLERRRHGREAAQITASKLFDAAWYVQRYPDVAKSGINPALHFLLHGARNGRDPGPDFSTKYYLDRYPEIAKSGRNPLVDYLNGGAAAGRNPNASFDSRAYLERNPDVARAGMNPLVHWVRFGKTEKRALTGNGARPTANGQSAAKRPGNGNGAVVVDVVIPVQGDGPSVQRLLKTLEVWRRPKGELILIEDGADADVRALIDDFFARVEGATLVRNLRARGLAAAINQGLAEITAPLAVVMTSVDAGTLRALDAKLSAARSAPDFELAALQADDGDQSQPTHAEASEAGVPGFVLARAVLAKVGFLDEQGGFAAARQDWERRALARAPIAPASPSAQRMN